MYARTSYDNIYRLRMGRPGVSFFFISLLSFPSYTSVRCRLPIIRIGGKKLSSGPRIGHLQILYNAVVRRNEIFEMCLVARLSRALVLCSAAHSSSPLKSYDVRVFIVHGLNPLSCFFPPTKHTRIVCPIVCVSSNDLFAGRSRERRLHFWNRICACRRGKKLILTINKHAMSAKKRHLLWYNCGRPQYRVLRERGGGGKQS